MEWALSFLQPRSPHGAEGCMDSIICLHFQLPRLFVLPCPFPTVLIPTTLTKFIWNKPIHAITCLLLVSDNKCSKLNKMKHIHWQTYDLQSCYGNESRSTVTAVHQRTTMSNTVTHGPTGEYEMWNSETTGELLTAKMTKYVQQCRDETISGTPMGMRSRTLVQWE